MCMGVALVLLLGSLGAAGAEETVMDRFLNDWITLLTMREDRYTQENDALQTIITYGETESWEDLVRARAAAAFTCDLVAYYAKTEVPQAMTEADYKRLIDQGMDIGDVRGEFSIYNGDTLADLSENVVPFWSRYYLANLMERAFDRNSVEEYVALAKAQTGVNVQELKYLYLINNYIALEVPEADAQRLYALAGDNAPGVMSAYRQPFTSVNDVLNEMNDTVNLLEEALLAYEKALALGYANLDAAQARFDRGESIVKPEERAALADRPKTLPWPTFWDSGSGDVTYYWRDAEGGVTAMSRGINRGEIPNCMHVSVPRVSREAYDQYVAQLGGLGLSPTEATDAAALYCFSDGTIFMMEWSQDGVRLTVRNGQICFAPAWYIASVSGDAGQPAGN